MELAPGFAADDLVVEVRRYLAAVEAFRAEGSDPVWLCEQPRLSDWTRVRAPRHRGARPPAKETEV